MLVSKTEKIPNKKIIKVIGNVSVKFIEWWNQDEGLAIKKLAEKATVIGANGIINFTYRGSGLFGTHGSANGLAVIVEDIKSSQIKDSNPLELLKLRLARGEISKEEFLELKELL